MSVLHDHASPGEIEPGVVFAKDDFTIEAFSVPHGAVAPAFGFRVTADDKTVVISGDTAYGETLLEMTLRSHLPGMRPTSGSAWL